MTPLQRAARSLCSGAGYDPDFDGGFVGVSGDWVEPGLPRWKEYLDDARFVLQAIREPSEAMIDAGWIDGQLKNVPRAWAAMIDAALEER